MGFICVQLGPVLLWRFWEMDLIGASEQLTRDGYNDLEARKSSTTRVRYGCKNLKREGGSMPASASGDFRRLFDEHI